jgi:hypothetical protein
MDQNKSPQIRLTGQLLSQMSGIVSNRSRYTILRDKSDMFRVKYQTGNEENFVDRLNQRNSVYSQSVLDQKS